MARPRGRIGAVCQYEECSFFRRENGKEIIKRGKSSSGTQMYKCLHCGKYLSETKGTPMFRRRLPFQKVKQICKHLVEKNGVRSVARLLKINKNTVVNWMNNLAEHALQITDLLVKDLGLSTYEVDEFWSFVKKNKKKLTLTARREISKATHGHIPV